MATLHLGDSREIVPTLPRPAAVISDPPFGQRLKTNIADSGGVRTHTINGPNGPQSVAFNVRSSNGVFRGHKGKQVWPDAIHGDDAPFDPAPWLNVADIVVLWGAHKFADRLPPGGWLVWDKVPTGKVRRQGDGEAAWINRDQPLRIYRLLWDGVCVGAPARHEVWAGQSRVHPTQKPEALMSWVIEQARVPAGGVILDPYAGSGSTLVAAIRRGHPCVGIEIEPRYYETMLRRVEAVTRQADLFARAAPTPDLDAAYQRPPRDLFSGEGA